MVSQDACDAKTAEQIWTVFTGAVKLVAFIACPIAGAALQTAVAVL